jgi:RNA polymerase sigma-32 factor
MEAAQRMIKSNLRLVVKIALSYQRYWIKNLLDLIQEGNLGLLQAVKKFDPYRGIKFSYYASFWIKAYILKFIMDNWNLVKIGTTQNQRKLFYGLAREREKLLAQGLDPAPRLLAERLDVKEEDIVEMNQRLSHSEVSFDAPLGEDTKESLGDRISGNGKGIERHISDRQRLKILTNELEKFRRTLSGKEADIFNKRIMAEEPLTLQELGNKHHISRERVRQIQVRTMQNIKEQLKKEIPDFEDQYNDRLQ